MKRKLMLLVLLNLGLVLGIFFLLHQVGAVDIPFLRPDERPSSQEVSEDPFLMEREALKKQWAVLMAKETDLEQRQIEFDKNSQLLQEKQKEINRQLEVLENNEKEKQKIAISNAQDEASIRSLADKVTNIPPISGAAILNDMDPIVAVETIQMMDKIATEKGSSSTTAYLISLMDPEKRKEVVRLLSAYPTTLGNLNSPPIPNLEEGDSENKDSQEKNN